MLMRPGSFSILISNADAAWRTQLVASSDAIRATASETSPGTSFTVSETKRRALRADVLTAGKLAWYLMMDRV
jgi:hypothetical protein